MIFKSSPFSIIDKNAKDLDNPNEYQAIVDLIKEHEVSKDKVNTVHRRRDLDSLG